MVVEPKSFGCPYRGNCGKGLKFCPECGIHISPASSKYLLAANLPSTRASPQAKAKSVSLFLLVLFDSVAGVFMLSIDVLAV